MFNIFKNYLVPGTVKNLSFFNHNCKYIDNIEILFYNPNSVRANSIMRPTIFEAKITFEKNNFRLYKTFNNNNYDNLIKDMQDFIEKEIKI